MFSSFTAIVFVVLCSSALGWPYMAKNYGDDFIAPSPEEPTGPRATKLSNSMAQALETAYTTLPSFVGKDITSAWNLLKFTTESMSASFTTVSDDLPKGRKKYIHPLGSVASAQFIPTVSHPYTGMFKGADSCLVRLSLAANPDKIAFTPGMAMKCFTDGPSPSANFIAMFSLDGQAKNWNFFENEFSNIIVSPTSAAMKAIEDVTFKRASRCPTWLSLEQFAATDQLGNTEQNEAHPIELWLVPAEVSFASSDSVDFRDDLITIPAGSTLWTVQVSDEKNGARKELGNIVSTSEFVSSSWGDEVLFFQHTLGETDDCPKD